MPEVISERSMAEDFDMDDGMMFPITDIDNNNAEENGFDSYHGSNGTLENGRVRGLDNQMFKPAMTLRQRRYSQLGIGNGPLLKLTVGLESTAEAFDPRRMWKKALRLIRDMKDPWERFNIDTLPEEKVVRHRYNALLKKWKVDEVTVKIEPEVR